MHFHDSKVKIVYIYIYIRTHSVLLSFLLLGFLFPCPLQLTFEPHWLKLQRFTYILIKIFFSSEYYSTILHDHCWVNLQIPQNQGYKKP